MSNITSETPATSGSLAALRDEVSELRDRIRAARQAQAAEATSAENAHRQERLLAERDALRAELAALEAASAPAPAPAPSTPAPPAPAPAEANDTPADKPGK
jgi:uncharacterized membrane protein YccC